MRETPRPNWRATENLPLEFAEGGNGLPAIRVGTGALGATGLSTGAICEEGAAVDAMGAGLSTDLSAEAICEEGAEVEAVCVGSAEVDAFCVPAVSESFAAIVADVALSASMTIRYGL